MSNRPLWVPADDKSAFLNGGAGKIFFKDFPRGIEEGDMEKKEESKLAEELQKMAKEPILPVEKKLVVYSLILGVVLLGVLYGISVIFFSVQP